MNMCVCQRLTDRHLSRGVTFNPKRALWVLAGNVDFTVKTEENCHTYVLWFLVVVVAFFSWKKNRYLCCQQQSRFKTLRIKKRKNSWVKFQRGNGVNKN